MRRKREYFVPPETSLFIKLMSQDDERIAPGLANPIEMKAFKRLENRNWVVFNEKDGYYYLADEHGVPSLMVAKTVVYFSKQLLNFQQNGWQDEKRVFNKDKVNDTNGQKIAKDIHMKKRKSHQELDKKEILTLKDTITDNTFKESLSNMEKTVHQNQPPAKEHKLYDDPVWLGEKYIREKMSTSKMAEEAGCNAETIRRKLKNHGITIRSMKEAQRSRFKPSAALHDDEQWLRQKYEVEQLSAKEIGKLAGTTKKMIQRRMKRFGIESREKNEAQRIAARNDISSSPFLKKFLTGSLLGDGCLVATQHQAYYTLTSKHLEYAELVAEFFEQEGVKTRIYKSEKIRSELFQEIAPSKSKKKIIKYEVSTHSTVQFREWYEKWYPKGQKVVPDDILLAPVSCLHWYLQDGTYNRISKTINLCTDCFSRKENEKLIFYLVEELDSNNITLHRSNMRIYMGVRSAIAFLKYIGGTSPVKCFNYKFSHSDL
ncbi:MAG: hypothetical protein ACFFD4_13115 [Candidatus Odinarchaeota archaeon]